MQRSFFKSALICGLIAGALDITAACIHAYLRNETMPEQILRGIAGGAFGKEAAANGNMMIVWGILFHFLIAMSFTFFFFLLAKTFPSLVKYPVPVAIAYGIFVWTFMRYIVLNYISTINIRPIAGDEVIFNAIIGAAILIVCIGLPNVLLSRKYLNKELLIKKNGSQEYLHVDHKANGIITAILGFSLMNIAQNTDGSRYLATKNLILYFGLALFIMGGVLATLAFTKKEN